jgi:hypothetical protein
MSQSQYVPDFNRLLSPDFALNSACKGAILNAETAVKLRKIGILSSAEKCANYAKEWAWMAYLIAQRG